MISKQLVEKGTIQAGQLHDTLATPKTLLRKSLDFHRNNLIHSCVNNYSQRLF